MQKRKHRLRTGSLFAVLAACGSDSGEGSARFTTWGEDYIESQIPADPSGEAGFVDGWTVTFDKFLVAFHAIALGNSDAEVAAIMPGSKIVDNVRPGPKPLVTFSGLEARRYPRVRYQIRPALPDSELVAATPEDRALMVAGGYAIYVAGRAEKPGPDGPVRKSFHWGFRTETQYDHCQHPSDSGHPIRGLVVTRGGTDISELTTHGDHLFYDRLATSDDPSAKTALRFEAMARADRDGDGEITLEELEGAPIDVRLYDPSGLPATSLGAFVTALARTVGHFRGEGECTVSAIR